MNKPERKHSLHLYLNDAENELLEEKFKQSKIKSKSEFIRRLIIDGYIIEVNFSELNRYNFLLSNISNNINQIAHRINETRSIYKSDIDSVQVSGFRQLTREYLQNMFQVRRMIPL